MQEKLEKKYHDKIHQLIPVNGLSPQFQKQLIRQAEIVMVPAGNSLFQQDKKCDSLFYLIAGEVSLFKDKDFVKTISAGTEHSKVAINQNISFSATAKSRVVLLMVKRLLVERLAILDGHVDLDKEASIDWTTQLLTSEVFSQIPPVNMQKMFERLDSMIVKKGDRVIAQNMPGSYFYIVREGRCVVSRLDYETDETITLAELEVGDCFGEEALLSDQKRVTTVTMLTAGKMMRLARNDYDELIRQPVPNLVDFEAASSRKNEGAEWLDVRFKDEYLQYRLKNSLNIPFRQLEQKLETLNKDKLYLICCDTGVRSSVAADLLRDRGFDASYLEGGLQQYPEGTDMSEKWLDDLSGFLRDGKKATVDVSEEQKESSDVNASMGVQIMEVDRRIRNLKELFNTEKTLAQDLLENSLSEKQSPEDIKFLIEARKRIDQIDSESVNNAEQGKMSDSGSNEFRVLRKQLETAQNHIQEERSRVSREEEGSEQQELTLRHVSDELETIKGKLKNQETFELKRRESFENQLATERKKVRAQLTRFSSGLARQQSRNMEVEQIRRTAVLETRQIIERFKDAHQQYRLRQQKVVQNVRVQLQKQAAEVIAKARQAQAEKVQALTSLRKVQKQLDELRKQRSSQPELGDISEVPLLLDVESIGDEIDMARDKFLEADAALSLAKVEKRQSQEKLDQMNKEEKRIRHELVEWITSNKQLNLERDNLTDEQKVSLDRVRKIAHEALEEAFKGNHHRPGNSDDQFFKNYK